MRTELITQRLNGTLRDLACLPVVVPIADWSSLPTGNAYRFGWTPPVAITPDHDRWVVALSPELIAATTDWLDDAALDRYLATIEMSIALHLESTQSSLSATSPVEDLLLDLGLGDDVQLRSQVELRALDLGLIDPP